MKELMRFAARLGIRVHAARLDDGVLGEWYEDEREVYFDLRMSPIEQLCTVAHELGHAHHGHRCEDDRRAEDQADEYAARILVDPRSYEQLERSGLSHHDIAEALGVTEEILHIFLQRCLVRLRGVTYVRARMGALQWAHRSEVA